MKAIIHKLRKLFRRTRSKRIKNRISFVENWMKWNISKKLCLLNRLRRYNNLLVQLDKVIRFLRAGVISDKDLIMRSKRKKIIQCPRLSLKDHDRIHQSKTKWMIFWRLSMLSLQSWSRDISWERQSQSRQGIKDKVENFQGMGIQGDSMEAQS